MIVLNESALYSPQEVLDMTGWHENTLRRHALRIGKEKRSKGLKDWHFSADEVRELLGVKKRGRA